MILFDSVSKKFKRKNKCPILALQEILFHIPRGMTVGIIGPSGAGKTTLLKLICGALQAEEGRVRVNSLDPIKHRKRLAGQVSILLADQSNANTEHTLRESLELMQAAYQISDKEFRKKREKLLQDYSLEPFYDTKLIELSLGVRRRAETALAFLVPAEVLLFDEPSIGMDVEAKQIFAELVQEEQRSGRTILISSHNMEEVVNLSQRILLLNQGKLVFYGGMERLLRFIAPVNQLEVTFQHSVPDFLDLPFVRYVREDRKIILDYNRNQITAAELLRGMQQTGDIEEISMRQTSLEEVIEGLSAKE